MNSLPIKAELVEKVSSKSGKKYLVVLLHLTDTYTKNVFLDPAELELLTINVKKQ